MVFSESHRNINAHMQMETNQCTCTCILKYMDLSIIFHFQWDSVMNKTCGLCIIIRNKNKNILMKRERERERERERDRQTDRQTDRESVTKLTTLGTSFKYALLYVFSS